MKGFIGFFDILGYRSFLENNSAIETVESVLKIIAQSGEETQKEVERQFPSFKKSSQPDEGDDVIFQGLCNPDHWLVFSDTIVHTLPMDNILADEEARPSVSLVCGLMSMVHGAFLQERMFSQGLPVRGVIHYGEFTRFKNCLAGQGIVEAYTLLESLDLACVAISERADKELSPVPGSHTGLANMIRNVSTPYLIPFKSGQERELSVLRWRDWQKLCTMDIEQCVHEAFWAHQKTVPLKVDTKIKNTVKYLRFLKKGGPIQFKSNP